MIFFAVIWSAMVFCGPVQYPYEGYWNGSYITITQSQCNSLWDTATPEYDDYASADFVLAHEEQHAHGVTDEHSADCGAVGNMYDLARQLGFSGYWSRWAVQEVRRYRSTWSLYGPIPLSCFPTNI